MTNISILDCTLRDGGCVNNFEFGHSYIKNILSTLGKANIDIIECGYIDENDGLDIGSTKFKSDYFIMNNYLKNDKVEGSNYVAMIDYGKFDVNNLSDRQVDGLDGIRLAFHKEDCAEAIEWGKVILDKGYDLYMQPMVTLRYTDFELLQLIDTVNAELSRAKALYIVDSFGEMRMDDITRIFRLVDHNLLYNIAIGFHSHNNLQLSYPNAVELLKCNKLIGRNIIVDASIMGMGKGAGNLCTEVFAEHLNLFYAKNYDLVPIFRTIDKIILQIYEEFRWGYSIEYYLSAINHCSPSYAAYFYAKHTLSIEQLKQILKAVKLEKRNSFDKKYAEELYTSFNNRNKINDKEPLELIRECVKDKKVVLLAPGKRLVEGKEFLEAASKDKNFLLISLNAPTIFNVDFALITKNDVERNEETREFLCKELIRTSNVNPYRIDDLVLDYSHWINEEGECRDAAIVIALNLLEHLGSREVFLAGFDGFTVNFDDNYVDKKYNRKMNRQQVKNRNEYICNEISKKRNSMKIEFITPSLYENQ